MASPLSPSAAAAPASILVQEASLVFHGTRYVLSLRSVAGSAARAPALLLSAWADDGSGGTWSASFSAQEIEQMTAKTGEFQPFVSLERMLGRALAAAEATDNGAREPHIIRHQHGAHFDTLQIDCLTYEQLDALKARRSASSGSSQTPRSQARRSLNKRYVILSLSHSEAPEERIHYPLPLPFKGNNREPPGREEDSGSADIADANGARTSQLQHALSTDVAALRSQIAKLTHSVHNEQANQTAQQQLQQARERERVRDRDRHSRSSRSHKPHSNKPPFIDDDSPRLHATRADRLASENAQLRSELAQLRDLAKLGPQSPSGASHSSALKNLPRRPGVPHHIKGDDESREFDLAEVDLPTAAWQGSEAERLKRVAALEAASAHAASRTIEASEELIESLQRRLEQAREAAQFEAEVAAKRIAGLEAENRLLRRSEAAALARLAKADEDMLAVMQEARMLKERVEEYMITTNNATAANTRTGARRGRSTTPVANRTNAAQSSSSARAGAPSPGRGGGGSAFPPLRGASASPSRRAPSPYLSGSGSGRASPGRGASPVVSGRSTPTRGGGGGTTSSHARSASPSYMQPMARSASARSPAPVPPLPLRARSRSPTPQRSNGVGAAGLSPSQSQRTAPLERSYTQWQVNSHEVKMPLKRFDPSMYIERRKQQLAQKAAQRYERIEGEITASPSALRGSSPLRRSTLGMSASVPAFSFVQSPGRAARSGAEGRPNGYVDPRGVAASPTAAGQPRSSRSTRSRSPSLSRAASLGPDSFAQAQPATAQPSSPSNDRLGHTKPVPGAQAADVLFTTVRTAVGAPPPPPGSGPLDDADNDPVARAARAAFREARTRELQLAQEEERARERARKMDAHLGLPADELSRVYASENARARAQVLNEPRHAWDAAERARQRALEPNIPRVELLDLGSDGVAVGGREPARDNQQLGALTQRLAKLQSYLAAEKQA
jgi:hypothetical protein